VELIVRIGEREERVRVERDGELWSVRVGERLHRVDRVATGGGRHSLVVDGEQRELAVLRLPDGRWWVGTGGGGVAAEVVDPLTHLARQAGGRSAGARAARVTASMPGRVVAVLVAAGDEVKAGQGLVVLEAMKMENEIQAEHDGVVREVFVGPGQAVEGGDPLFELE
jgi:pyruvate carboxylase subunit B